MITIDIREDKKQVFMLDIRRATYIIFLVLFIGRILESVLVGWVGQGGYAPYWWDVTYLVSGYILISITLYINKHDLRGLNIDKHFVLIFILMGGLYSLLLPFAVGILLGLASLFNLIAFWKRKFQFEDAHQNYWQLLSLMVLFLAPDLFMLFWSGKYRISSSELTIINTVFTANLPLVIFEEVIFRGILWMILKNLNMKVLPAILVQSFLFWITHFNYISSQPLTFWLLLPFASILLALVVWRSKSIKFSLFIHYLHNFLIFLYHLY